MELSTEGGNATYYRDNDNKIKIITTELYGEMGMSYEEYYFNNDSMFFSYSEERNYNAPMYYDSTAAKSDGGEPFDVKKTKIEQQRFYFSRNKLIQWLDPQMKSVAKDESYYKKEKDILEFCHLLLK